MLQEGSENRLTDTSLFFAYGTPFHYFLRQLEDATQLCVKAHSHIDRECGSFINAPRYEGLEFHGAPSSEAPSITSDRAKAIDQTGQQESSPFSSNPSTTSPYFLGLGLQMTSNQTTRNNSEASRLATSHILRDPVDRGYTLDHGPWYYYVAHETCTSEYSWIQLTDANEYAVMLSTIRKYSASCPATPALTKLIHVSVIYHLSICKIFLTALVC